MMQLDRIRATAKESIPGLERVDDFEGVEELAKLYVGLDLPVPLAFPYDFGIIASLSQTFLFLEGGLVNFIEGAVGVTNGMSVTVTRKAFGTAVPKTSVEFVHGGTMGGWITGIESIHQISIQHAYFASVSDSADTIPRSRVLLSQLVFLPG